MSDQDLIMAIRRHEIRGQWEQALKACDALIDLASTEHELVYYGATRKRIVAEQKKANRHPAVAWMTWLPKTEGL